MNRKDSTQSWHCWVVLSAYICPHVPLSENIIQRYGSLPGVLHMIELEKGKTGLGLSLAGNRDRSRMSVFVVGIDPSGAAGRDGRMVVGDELLEVARGLIEQLMSLNLEHFFLITIVYFLIDQRASPLRPQSSECLLHNQELSIQSQNHLCQV